MAGLIGEYLIIHLMTVPDLDSAYMIIGIGFPFS